MEHHDRLQLKPYRSASEHIDGAWWPRSTHLVDELPDLAASLSDRLGRVVMVGYRHNGWDETPPLAEIAGQTIEFLGFSSDEPASVILIGEDGRHITLHVIRPDTAGEVARQALEEAGVPADAAPAGRPTVARSAATAPTSWPGTGGSATSSGPRRSNGGVRRLPNNSLTRRCRPSFPSSSNTSFATA